MRDVRLRDLQEGDEVRFSTETDLSTAGTAVEDLRAEVMAVECRLTTGFDGDTVQRTEVRLREATPREGLCGRPKPRRQYRLVRHDDGPTHAAQVLGAGEGLARGTVTSLAVEVDV